MLTHYSQPPSIPSPHAIKPESTREINAQKKHILPPSPPPNPPPSGNIQSSAAQPRRRLSTTMNTAGDTTRVRASKPHWTNEKHVHFLNSMEASFVQTMLENSRRFPPLDRYLPDTSDSTEDLARPERRRRNSTSDMVERRGRKTDKKTKIIPCQNSSQDQVVPQFQKKRDNKDKEQKDHLDVSLGTTTNN